MLSKRNRNLRINIESQKGLEFINAQTFQFDFCGNRAKTKFVSPLVISKANVPASKASRIHCHEDQSSAKSSTSSSSWNDECDREVTQKVQDELHKMDNVLRRVIPIPVNYDQDEYSLWIRTFPANRLKNRNQSRFTLDHRNIAFLYNVPSHKLLPLDQKRENIKRKSILKQGPNNKVNLPLNIPMDNPLEIISSHLSPTFTRNHSRNDFKSIYHFSTPNGLQNGSPESMSLPHLESLSMQDSRFKTRSKTNNSLHNHQNLDKAKHVVLPPIVRNSFRSISATPTNHFKSSSALSLQGNTKLNICNRKGNKVSKIVL